MIAQDAEVEPETARRAAKNLVESVRYSASPGYGPGTGRGGPRGGDDDPGRGSIERGRTPFSDVVVV